MGVSQNYRVNIIMKMHLYETYKELKTIRYFKTAARSRNNNLSNKHILRRELVLL